MKRQLAIGTLLLVAMGVTRAGPVVQVSAPVKAETFIENLEDGRIQVETQLAATVVTLTKRHFPVLDWRTSATGPAAQLMLALTEVSAAGAANRVQLEWRAKVGAADKDLPNLDPIVVYDTFDIMRETHDPAVLGALLKTKVDAWFGLRPNRDSFSSAFLNLVPLAHSVAVDPAAQRIVLPFPMSGGAKIGQRSRIVVRFVANDGGAPKTGSISMSDLLEESRASKLSTLAVVSAFEFATIPKVNGWSPRIESLLRNPVQSNVFFDEYILSEATVVDDVMVSR